MVTNKIIEHGMDDSDTDYGKRRTNQLKWQKPQIESTQR